MQSVMISESAKETVCFIGRHDCFSIREFLEELNDPDGEPLMAPLREKKKDFVLYFIDGLSSAGEGKLHGETGKDIYTVLYKAAQGEFGCETYDETLSRLTPDEMEAKIRADQNLMN